MQQFFGVAFTDDFCVVRPKDANGDDDLVNFIGRKMPASMLTFERLWACATPSTYGDHFGARVLDQQIRASREIDEGVLLNPKFVEAVLLETKRALSCFSAVASLRFHKLLLYDTDGAFGMHTDQLRHVGMTHTVVVNVPVAGGSEYLFQVGAGNEPTLRRDEGALTACVFTSTLHHSMRMVRGRRMALVFHLISDAAFGETFGSVSSFKPFVSTSGFLHPLTAPSATPPPFGVPAPPPAGSPFGAPVPAQPDTGSPFGTPVPPHVDWFPSRPAPFYTPESAPPELFGTRLYPSRAPSAFGSLAPAFVGFNASAVPSQAPSAFGPPASDPFASLPPGGPAFD